jgi:3-oxoacyl-[acyl-carrier protein] reductase
MSHTLCSALVTGASRGIGAAIARELAARGHRVIVNFRSDQSGAEAVAATIRDAGGEVEVVQFDVRDAAATHSAIERLLADAEIGIVVNNAGISRDAAFPSLTPEAWQDVTRTSLDGFFNVTQPLVMPMVRRKWGRIVSITSVSATMGNRGQTNYAAAKAGLIGATKSLSRELAKRKVTVNAVSPGLIDTEMLSGIPIDKALELVPMRRLGRPEEVAKLVAFLASDDAAYITGQVIGINGGII